MPDDEDERQLEELGVPHAQILAARQIAKRQEPDDDVPVAPHLAEACEVFANLRSQWRTASAGLGGFVFTGLDYSALEPTLRLLSKTPKHTASLFQRLRVMEMEALAAMNERR